MGKNIIISAIFVIFLGLSISVFSRGDPVVSSSNKTPKGKAITEITTKNSAKNDSKTMRQVSGLKLNGYSILVEIYDNKAYVVGAPRQATDERTLHIIDMADPEHPSIIDKNIKLGRKAGKIGFLNKYAYITTCAPTPESKLEIIDITSKNTVTPVKKINAGICLRDVEIVENYALITDFGVVTGITKNNKSEFKPGEGLKIFSLISPQEPKLIGGIKLGCRSNGIKVVKNHAYVLDQGGGCRGAFLAGGYHNDAGLKVIDITNPVSPKLVGSLIIHGPVKIVIYENYAYITHLGFHKDGKYYSGGLKIVDISDPKNPKLVGELKSDDFSYGAVLAYRNHLYVSYCNEETKNCGIALYSIKNRAAPEAIGKFKTASAVHSMQAYRDYLYLAGGLEGLKVLSLSH
jgi:hypothetical protein